MTKTTTTTTNATTTATTTPTITPIRTATIEPEPFEEPPTVTTNTLRLSVKQRVMDCYKVTQMRFIRN